MTIALPFCRHRRDSNGVEREIEPGLWPCQSPKLIKPRVLGEPVVPAEVCAGQCPFVDHQREPPKSPSALTKRVGLPCVFLGPHTGWRECVSCRGKTKLKEFTCLHPAHEKTTIPDCKKCADYEAKIE